jgi:hypothetical protein
MLPSVLLSNLPDQVISRLSTWGRRVRKANVLSLNTCNCGITITEAEMNTGTNVMRCQVPGCETVWVCNALSLSSGLSAVLLCTYYTTCFSTINRAWIMILHLKTGHVRAVQVVSTAAVVCSFSPFP